MSEHRHYLKAEMEVGVNVLEATLICRACGQPIPYGARVVRGWFETCHRPLEQRPATWCFMCFKRIADAIGGG